MTRDFTSRLIETANFVHVAGIENGMIDFQQCAVAGFFFEKISRRTNIDGRIGNDFFAQRIDRRIGDLREQLLENNERAWDEVSRAALTEHRFPWQAIGSFASLAIGKI